jgi:hypothetical protein
MSLPAKRSARAQVLASQTRLNDLIEALNRA